MHQCQALASNRYLCTSFSSCMQFFWRVMHAVMLTPACSSWSKRSSAFISVPVIIQFYLFIAFSKGKSNRCCRKLCPTMRDCVITWCVTHAHHSSVDAPTFLQKGGKRIWWLQVKQAGNSYPNTLRAHAFRSIPSTQTVSSKPKYNFRSECCHTCNTPYL
jgi:hypothetical protein